MPPTKRLTTTKGFERSKLTTTFSSFDLGRSEKNLISSVYAANKTKAPTQAEPVADRLVTAFVVLPTASKASVVFLTFLGKFDISAIPPALSVTGP